MKWTANVLVVTALVTSYHIAVPSVCIGSNLNPAQMPSANSADKLPGNSNGIAPNKLQDDLLDDITVPVKDTKIYSLEVAGSFNDYMPRGIAITKDDRIFVCFPRHEPNHDYTFAELKDKKTVPYPNVEINRAEINDAKNHLISVMSAALDNKNRLWVLDCGRIVREQIKDGCKLVAIDLQTGKIVKTISFSNQVLLPTSLFKDLRINSAIGKDGTAIIIDSAPAGASAIIVVDLESGNSIRRLDNHPSVNAEPDFVVFADGEMLLLRESEDKKKDWTPGASGLAMSADGKELYYSPLSSNDIYSVSMPLLCDATASEMVIEKTVKSIGKEVGASDGIESDSQNRLYLTDVENNTIWRRRKDGKLEALVKDDRLCWPDRLYLANNGCLYVTVSQFHLCPWFHYRVDKRRLPFELFRIKVEAQPVQLQ